MTTTLPLREATADDAQSILDLHLLADLAEIGEPNTTIDEVRTQLAMTPLVATVIDDPAGGLIGHGWFEHQDGFVKSWGDVTVRPGGDPSILAALLEWLCRESARRAPGVPLHLFTDSGNAAKVRLFEAAGGELIRRFYRMVIDLDATPPVDAPDLGPDVEIRTISHDASDLRVMHGVIDTAFVDHFAHDAEPFEMWRDYTVGECPDPSLWWLATVAGEPAAGLYACRLGDAGYVDTLGTLREHRGRGLGRALLLTAFEEFRRRGWPKAVLGVDATNPTGALGLYESVGMTVQREGWRYALTPSAPAAVS